MALPIRRCCCGRSDRTCLSCRSARRQGCAHGPAGRGVAALRQWREGAHRADQAEAVRGAGGVDRGASSRPALTARCCSAATPANGSSATSASKVIAAITEPVRFEDCATATARVLRHTLPPRWCAAEPAWSPSHPCSATPACPPCACAEPAGAGRIKAPEHLTVDGSPQATGKIVDAIPICTAGCRVL